MKLRELRQIIREEISRVRLNENKQDIEDEGFDAYYDGKKKTQNPYKVGSDEYEYWDMGYTNAQINDLK